MRIVIFVVHVLCMGAIAASGCTISEPQPDDERGVSICGPTPPEGWCDPVCNTIDQSWDVTTCCDSHWCNCDSATGEWDIRLCNLPTADAAGPDAAPPDAPTAGAPDAGP